MSDEKHTPMADSIISQLTNLFDNYAKGKIYIEDVKVGLVFALVELRGLEAENAKLREELGHKTHLLGRLINDLPSRRDWLDPELEKLARQAIAGEQPS